MHGFFLNNFPGFSEPAHSFARNWQLPFLNQPKVDHDRREYLMISHHERMVPDQGIKPVKYPMLDSALSTVLAGPAQRF